MTWFRVSSRWTVAALVAYLAGLALFWPRVLAVVDEERYVSQAVAFAMGRTTVPGSGILYPATGLSVISNYPPGTSLLQAPFVWLFGWRGAVLLSLAGLLVATLVTARWLRDCGRDPAFALLVPGFAGTLLFSRIAMSDVPSAAIVALACWLLWRARSGSAGVAFLAGLSAGATLLFREPPAVLLAPLVLGAVFRRALHVPALLAGGVVAVACRMGLSLVLFGSPFYIRDPGIAFSLASFEHTGPLFALLLVVLVPGGLLLPILYRGERRPELAAAVAVYVTLFLSYDYNSVRDHGALKGALLASRFLVPALPVLAFMAGEVWPRIAAKASVRVRRVLDAVTALAAAGVIAAAFLVHPIAHAQEREPSVIVSDVYAHTSPAVPVVTNPTATLKYFSPAYGPRRLILRNAFATDSLAAVVRRHGALDVVLLSRHDGELFRHDAAANHRFLADIQTRCTLLPRASRVLAWGDLRILEIRDCARR